MTRYLKNALAVQLPVLLCMGTVSAQSFVDVGQQTGVVSGLAVHVGTTTASLAVEFAQSGRFLFQGLCGDSASVRAVRQELAGKGLYGLSSVSFEASFARLPYADGIVNLLLCDMDQLGTKAPPRSEIDRVLAYSGVACLKQNGTWGKSVKVLPATVDDWGHQIHGPDRNPLSKDQLVGPFSGIKWSGGPDSRKLALGGRVERGVVFVLGALDNPTAKQNFLLARDAYSGVLLWKVPVDMGAYHSGMGSFEGSGAFTASNGKVYLYPGKAGSVMTCYDSRTGKILKAFTEGAHIIVPSGYYLIEGQIAIGQGKIVQNYQNRMWIYDEEDGALVWQHTESDSSHFLVSPVIADNRLIVAVTRRRPEKVEIGYLRKHLGTIKCFDLASGKQLWENTDYRDDSIGYTFFNMSGHANGYQLAFFYHGIVKGTGPGWEVGVIRASDGKLLWRRDTEAPDLQKVNSYIVGNRVFVTWVMGSQVFDLVTGTVQGRTIVSQWNCNFNIATPNYLYWGPLCTPIKDIVMSPTSQPLKRYLRNHSARTACGELMVPAYGMTYSFSTNCGCEHFIPGMNALYDPGDLVEVEMSKRLQKEGSTTVTTACQPTSVRNTITADWYQYLQTGSGGKSKQPIWQQYAQQTLPPVNADDMQLIAHFNEHRVEAIKSGSVAWNFFADGRIAASPIVADGLAYIASHDGWVYAASVADGSLTWRFRVEPMPKRIVAFGQVESVWPVMGMLVSGSTLYASAGRHPELDHGIFVYALDVKHGTAKWRVRIVRHPETEATGRAHNRTINTQLLLESGQLKYAGTNMSAACVISLNDPSDIVLFGTPLATSFDSNHVAHPARSGCKMRISGTTMLVRLSEPGPVECALYNMVGQQIWKVTAFGNSEARIDLKRSGVAAGNYSAALRTSGGIQTGKVGIAR